MLIEETWRELVIFFPLVLNYPVDHLIICRWNKVCAAESWKGRNTLTKHFLPAEQRWELISVPMSSPAVNEKSWEQNWEQSCLYASFPIWLDVITVRSGQANFLGAQFSAENEMPEEAGRHWDTHQDKSCLMSSWWEMLSTESWIRGARIYSCNQISLPALKCHSSHPQLCLYSILWCFWVPKWMVLFHRWISWSETSCPVSLTWRGKNPAWERHWGLKNLIHRTNLFGILAFSWDLQSISSWT